MLKESAALAKACHKYEKDLAALQTAMTVSRGRPGGSAGRRRPPRASPTPCLLCKPAPARPLARPHHRPAPRPAQQVAFESNNVVCATPIPGIYNDTNAVAASAAVGSSEPMGGPGYSLGNAQQVGGRTHLGRAGPHEPTRQLRMCAHAAAAALVHRITPPGPRLATWLPCA